MSDEIARKTAEDFRLLGGQPQRATSVDPFNAAPPAADATVGAMPVQPPVTAQAQGGAAAIEAALERALRKALADQPSSNIASAEVIARLEEMKARAGERDDELAFELRNGLPGRLRREMHEQLRPTEDRLVALERKLAEEQPKRGYGPALAGGVLFAVLTGLIICAAVIFERPLRNWGQDTLFPVLGIGLPEAQRVQPGTKKAPPLGDR